MTMYRTLFRRSVIANQRGMGLVGVMISASVAGVLALGMGQLLTNMVKGVDNVQKTVDIQDAVAEVKMSMIDPVNCTATLAQFSTKTFDSSIISDGFIQQGISINKFITSAGIVLQEKNTQFKGVAKSNLDQMTLVNLQAINEASGLFLADIQFQVDKGGVGIGVQRIIRKFPIVIEAQNTGGTNFLITKCYASPANSIQDIKNILAQVCTSQGGTFEPVTSACRFTNAFCTNLSINACFTAISTQLTTMQTQIAALGNQVSPPPPAVTQPSVPAITAPPPSPGYMGHASLSSANIDWTAIMTGNGQSAPTSVNTSPCAVGATYSGYYNCGPWVIGSNGPTSSYKVCQTWTAQCMANMN
ncbi:MAG: hypothetical protein JNL11_02275 [Bdellovibrionaceae bacterium]|nr:hypothetical protein [Pseudobdellovibrionaceae bacterium]